MYDLNAFRWRVLQLCRATPPAAGGQRHTQTELAREVGLARAELSRRLGGKSRTPLSCENARAIVLTLARWGALQTQDGALELLRLVDCPPFSAEEWQRPPLGQLAPLSPAARAQLGQTTGNLPLQLTSFVGREQELALVAARLTDSRLLTITGGGGMGKTRFAFELARRLLPAYRDGVFVVMLSSLDDGSLVARAVATALGVRAEPGRDIGETLADWLRPRQLLLVVDNCEHLRTACAALSQWLLQECPALTILATSRERLGIASEMVWQLPPLALPETDGAALRNLDQAAAVQLFVARAKAAQPDFRLTAENAAAIVAISQQLEGIPLAIELAAALVRGLSIGQIASRLDDRFRLLRSRDPTAEPRQQTLNASLEWSYDLLSPPERTLLRRLAAFAGGWTLEAAEAVCADPTARNLQSTIYNLQSNEVLTGQIGLINKSLVQISRQDEQVRYTMLETIREYAAGKLVESGEQEAARLRHAQFYLDLSELAAGELAGAAQGLWLDRLEQELGNLNAALAWLLIHEPLAALRLATALYRFWYIRGYLTEGRQLLEAALTAAENPPPALFARACTAVGALAFEQGDYRQAVAFYRRGLAQWRRLGDKAGIAQALNNLSVAALEQGQYEAAQAYAEQSLALKRELGSEQGIANALTNLGRVFYYRGDYERARANYEAALTILRKVGSESSVIVLLNNLGNLAADQGDYAVAQQMLAECLGMAEELRDKQATAEALDSLGGVAYHQGDADRAYSLYRRSLEMKQELGDRRGIAYSLEGIAVVVATDKPLLAARLLSAAQSLREAIGIPRQAAESADYDRTVAYLCSHLSAAELNAAQRAGATMDLEQAIAYAHDLGR